MRQPAVVSITTSPFPKGPLLVDQPAVIKVFTATSAYDPAVNKLPVFATVSYVEPAVERLAPPLMFFTL